MEDQRKVTPSPSPPASRSIANAIVDMAALPLSTLDGLRLTGPDTALASSFAVTTSAQGLVAAFAASIAHLASARSSTNVTRHIEVDSVEACAAFQSERHLRRQEMPRLWDELSGHYATADGFIQFHTNFAHHRSALLTALGLPVDAGRAEVVSKVAAEGRFELEELVGKAGGIAAALRSSQEWDQHPHAKHVDGRPPLLVTTPVADSNVKSLPPTESVRPLAGVRVLDLTRVIAGPVCTRALAAYGADVLRIGAPNLPVVESLLPDTTLGKRFAHCDITNATGRDRVLELVADADVVVSGFRPGALAGYGIDEAALREANPSLVIGSLSAFGTDGPWGGRRGFDSITQTATGIVAEETEAFGSTKPRPLPCQFLDHGTGYLLAIGVVAALAARQQGQRARTIETSLLATRNWLESLGRTSPTTGSDHLDEDALRPFTRTRATSFGEIRHIAHPGGIEGIPSSWDRGPSAPGADEPRW